MDKGVLNMATMDSYMTNTLANWVEISTADFAQLSELGQHHYVSDSGSKYFEYHGEIYRQSDHWGAMIAGCAWFIDGRTLSRMVSAKCALVDFKVISLDAAIALPLSSTSLEGVKRMWETGRYVVVTRHEHSE